MNQLAQEKFAAWDAIYGKNPRFNLERTGRFPGGKLTFRLDVQRGVIRSASVWGDFFSTLSAEAITGALTGCRYDRAAVLDALRKTGSTAQSIRSAPRIWPR
ncbi:MAG: lipoate protein ligase C-terminal domain-containing protein [Acutalibacteraceae bacterium]